MISTDILLNLLKDKATGIQYLLSVLDESARQREGMTKLQASLEHNTSPENVAKCIQTTMKVCAKQADAIQNLAALMLVYMQSSSFDGDIARMLMKMGKGDEALRQMFKNKMEGK